MVNKMAGGGGAEAAQSAVDGAIASKQAEGLHDDDKKKSMLAKLGGAPAIAFDSMAQSGGIGGMTGLNTMFSAMSSVMQSTQPKGFAQFWNSEKGISILGFKKDMSFGAADIGLGSATMDGGVGAAMQQQDMGYNHGHVEDAMSSLQQAAVSGMMSEHPMQQAYGVQAADMFMQVGHAREQGASPDDTMRALQAASQLAPNQYLGMRQEGQNVMSHVPQNEREHIRSMPAREAQQDRQAPQHVTWGQGAGQNVMAAPGGR